MQHSAFEVILSDGAIDDLQRRISDTLKIDSEDTVRFYPLCSACAPKARLMGRDQPFFPSPDFAIV